MDYSTQASTQALRFELLRLQIITIDILTSTNLQTLEEKSKFAKFMPLELPTDRMSLNIASSAIDGDHNTILGSFQHANDRFQRWFDRFSISAKVGIIIGSGIVVLLQIWALVNYQLIIDKMVELSDHWRLWGFKGIVLLFLIVFAISFPPCVGFNMCSVFAGMVYGFSGWPLLALAAVSGSTASFALFKYLLGTIADEMMEHSDNLKLFADVLTDPDATFAQNLLVLTLLRFSPLPYSFSNGAMGAIPGIPVVSFAIASAISSPKYFLQLFVGTQLRDIGNGNTSASTKIAKFTSILIATGAFAAASYLIFSRMKAKAVEQQRLGGDNYEENGLNGFNYEEDGFDGDDYEANTLNGGDSGENRLNGNDSGESRLNGNDSEESRLNGNDYGKNSPNSASYQDNQLE